MSFSGFYWLLKMKEPALKSCYWQDMWGTVWQRNTWKYSQHNRSSESSANSEVMFQQLLYLDSWTEGFDQSEYRKGCDPRCSTWVWRTGGCFNYPAAETGNTQTLRVSGVRTKNLTLKVDRENMELFPSVFDFLISIQSFTADFYRPLLADYINTYKWYKIIKLCS